MTMRATPSQRETGDVLVKPEAGEDGDDDVAEGGGGEDEGDVGPA